MHNGRQFNIHILAPVKKTLFAALLIFVHSNFAYAGAPPIWSIDNQPLSDMTFNFNWINDGSAQFDSNTHTVKLLLKVNSRATVQISPPTSCKIGSVSFYSNHIFFLINGVPYLKDQVLQASVFRKGAGATVAVRITGMNSQISGLASCRDGGSLILNY